MKHRFFLSISLVLCAGLVACTKDYEPAPLGPDGHQKLSADQVFWNVVGKIVGMDQMTPDYKGKTFSPIIGEETEPGVRVVSVNSLRAAVDRFNGLTGANIDVNTPSYTWSNSEVGSITRNKGDGTTAWGTADLALPSVPSLTRIIYRSPEQGDTNGGVEGGIRAYYRFGDVISRTRPADKKGDVEFPAITEYWVCVRPAFHPEGKGESHWVSLSPLPRENVWPYYSDDYNYGPYPGSNGNGYGCPYDLGDDLEWLQDFNEMLHAIITAGANPQNFGNWYTNANNYYHEGWFGADGLLIFNDFTKENLQYHNDFFWQNVKNGWNRFDIFTKLLGAEADGTKHDQAWVSSRVQNGGRGLNYLHTGYSWWTWFSNDLDLYQATYKSAVTDDHKQLNMHSVENKTVTKQVTNPSNKTDAATNIPFNVKTECSPERPFVINEKFFGDKEPRFIYRYATGQQLAKMGGGTWHAQFALQGFQEVYRYYGNGGFEPDHILTMPPEITQSVASTVENDPSKQIISTYNGDSYYKMADVYKDQNGHRWFVAWMSGNWDGGLEGSPYTELISFDGIQTGADGVYGSNLPTRNQAIRGTIYLWNLLNNTVGYNDEAYYRASDAAFARDYYNILDYAGVDFRTIIQVLKSTNGQQRDMPALASVAFKDGSTDKQRLMRYICDISISPKKMPSLMFWDHYPSAPYLEPKLGTAFSSTNIYLQDVNDQSKINSYANDLYAKQDSWIGGDNYKTGRSIRSSVEPKAAKFSNYIYNKATWSTFDYPTDMWNAPVLAFRITRIYDRGDIHATKTVDNLTLELVHARFWETDALMSDYEQERGIQNTLYTTATSELYMDGVKIAFPSWTKWNE